MAIIIQITKEETYVEVTFRSDSLKEYRLLVKKQEGTAVVYTDFIHYMNYGHEKTGHAYKVFEGTTEDVKKYKSLEHFISQFK